MTIIRSRFSLIIFLLASLLLHAPLAAAAEPPKLDAARFRAKVAEKAQAAA